MNILILTPFYPPVISTLSNMVYELSIKLFNKGHNVSVFTTVVRKRLSPDERKKEIKHYSFENGVKIIRIESKYQFSSNFIVRGIYQILLPYLFWFNIKNKIGTNIDVIFTYSPPLAWAVLGRKIKNKTQARYILNIQDIFPQNAIDLGVLKNRLLIKYFEYQEKNVYESADKLTSHTKNSRDFLITKKGIPPSKIELITNWINISIYTKEKDINYYREIFNLKNKFIFLFAGMMGPSQDLDFIIEIAQEIKYEYPNICFLFVGDGIEKKRLMGRALKYNLKNIIFKPLVSKDDYPKLLKSVDVGIVCLSSMNKTGVYPAKVFGYMASSLPVCAILHKESDGHDLIKESNCGISIFSDKSRKTKKNVFIKMYNENNILKSYGENGLKYVTEHFSIIKSMYKIENLIKNHG